MKHVKTNYNRDHYYFQREDRLKHVPFDDEVPDKDAWRDTAIILMLVGVFLILLAAIL